MTPRLITHRSIFLTLIAGFALVIALLLAAALAGVRNIRSIQRSASSLVSEQAVTNRLIDELRRHQSSLSEVFGVLALDPDNVDYVGILNQLDEADRDIDRISSEGAQTPEHALWTRLKESSLQFSNEARHILAIEEPETYAPAELFRDHEAFISVVARLVEAEYHKVTVAQTQLNGESSALLEYTFAFTAASVLLALIFAVITVGMVLRLTRQMEWQTTELARVSWHMLEDQEATAQRFSHELHDELGQSLTAIKTNLAAIPDGAPRLQDCLHLVDDAIGNVRQMSQLLRPTILDDFGLEAGLRWLADGFSARTGIPVEFSSDFTGRLPDQTETHLYRIAQEALTNVARHSGASHVRLSLESQPGAITLRVQDDGHGFSTDAANPRGMGMIGMRARARSASGDVTVRSEAGHGVVIEVKVPRGHETDSHPAG